MDVGRIALIALVVLGLVVGVPLLRASDDATESDDAEAVLDWEGTAAAPLGDGWSVARCEGEAALLCVRDARGEVRGAIELLRSPVADADGIDGSDAVRRAAESLLAAVRDDRARGCPTLTFDADPVVATSVGGSAGLRTGFALSDADGRTVERTVVWFADRDGERFVVNATALGEGACLARIGELGVADLDRVLGPLDALVARSPLPRP